MYLNKVLLYGNLTRDPESRALPSGQQVVTFGLATNRTYKDKASGSQKEQTEFHNIVAFGRVAEVMGQYLKKGRPVYVEGRMQTRSWEADGKKNYKTEIVVDNFQFGADGGPAGGSRGAGAAQKGGNEQDMPEAPGGGDAIQYPDEEINPEDIPF
ncbi:MAG: single-stranded DNA-binding protein [Candidatus Pacebacteria bacterium]|nr:single-stranded DNA-binding protein [Candidatus Paceibacterota bacterium]MBP9840024.1 single-stranded DNA-binding protein [Candidatus Paceibacterota bacterium]